MLPVLLLVLVVKCQQIKSSNEGVKDVPWKGITPGYQERYKDSERRNIDDVVLVRPDILRLNTEDKYKENTKNVDDKEKSFISSVDNNKDGHKNLDNRKSFNEANRFLNSNYPVAINVFPFSDPQKGFKSVDQSKLKGFRPPRTKRTKRPKPITKRRKPKTTTEKTYVYVTVSIDAEFNPGNKPPPSFEDDDDDDDEEVLLVKRLSDPGVFNIFNFK
ncbi:unnamed protein product [Pieris macdunnoughi]|uniref:Uncharacterized protein n=1 Tax=Pieris macdunnoughi TaxID=345717 RepID=A0A821KXG9_9NEOP|nr:unnamed protein product [Pieris macdunnoughi]